jgi:hypothetical protein
MIQRVVSPEDAEKVRELRGRGLSRKEIADRLQMSFYRIRYIISLYHLSNRKKRVWYRAERKTFTDAMPNPFYKWWCEEHNLDHNFYRPKWKDQ